jgi:hypothetical protein
MKKEIVQAIMALLEGVSEIRWIDADEGQLDFTDSRPPVAFPCCLVDIGYRNTDNISANSPLIQRATVIISIKIAFNDCASFNSSKPMSVRNAAFARLDLVDKIHQQLQGKRIENCASTLSRKNCHPQKRPDGLKVYETTYNIDYIDKP